MNGHLNDCTHNDLHERLDAFCYMRDGRDGRLECTDSWIDLELHAMLAWYMDSCLLIAMLNYMFGLMSVGLRALFGCILICSSIQHVHSCLSHRLACKPKRVSTVRCHSNAFSDSRATQTGSSLPILYIHTYVHVHNIHMHTYVLYTHDMNIT